VLSRRNLVILTYLQNVDALPGDVAINLVLVVEVPSVHLGRLIHCMFNLHCDTAARLRLLDKLREKRRKEKEVRGLELDQIDGRRTHVVVLVVDFQ